MPAIKLNDPAWQSAIDVVAPKLDRYRQRMSNISADLRTLEKFLTDSTFRVDTRVYLQDSRYEKIGWAANGDDAWRLYYFWPLEDGDGYEFKPLIEAPVSVRWRAAETIPTLINEIGKVATPSNESGDPEPVELTDDDIPF